MFLALFQSLIRWMNIPVPDALPSLSPLKIDHENQIPALSSCSPPQWGLIDASHQLQTGECSFTVVQQIPGRRACHPVIVPKPF